MILKQIVKCVRLTLIWLGTIHILRKQKGWVGGVGKMLTFAYMVGGWVEVNAYVSKILEITRTFDIIAETSLIISQPHINFCANFKVQNRFFHRKVDQGKTKCRLHCLHQP